MKRHVVRLWLVAAVSPFLMGGCAVPASLAEGEAVAPAPANEQLDLDDVEVRVLAGEVVPAEENVLVFPEIPEERLDLVVEARELEERKQEAIERLCVGRIAQGAVAGMTATPGPGSAEVTWYHPGDTDVVGYRLTAISQKLVRGEQPELRWQEVAAPEGCKKVVATVTGLDRNTPYVFSVDAVRVTVLGDTVRSLTVARSEAVSTT